MATLYYHGHEVENFQALVNEPFDLASPLRSTVPHLAYWADVDARLVEFGNALGIPIPNDASLSFELTVSPPQGRGKASHTDLLVQHPPFPQPSSFAIATEAKYTEPKYETVAEWLGKPVAENKTLVLEGWLELINHAAGCHLTVEQVPNCTYQLIHRTASVCSLGGEHRAVVYHVFNADEAKREYYGGQLGALASLIAAPERLSFFLYMTNIEMTGEYELLVDNWRAGVEPDVNVRIRQLLIAGSVATFTDPVVLKFGRA